MKSERSLECRCAVCATFRTSVRGVLRRVREDRFPKKGTLRHLHPRVADSKNVLPGSRAALGFAFFVEIVRSRPHLCAAIRVHGLIIPMLVGVARPRSRMVAQAFPACTGTFRTQRGGLVHTARALVFFPPSFPLSLLSVAFDRATHKVLLHFRAIFMRNQSPQSSSCSFCLLRDRFRRTEGSSNGSAGRCQLISASPTSASGAHSPLLIRASPRPSTPSSLLLLLQYFSSLKSSPALLTCIGLHPIRFLSLRGHSSSTTAGNFKR